MSYWIFSDLRRPQYPPTPDVLQSALAWSFFDAPQSTPPRGFVFDRQSENQPRQVHIVSTRPDHQQLDGWRKALLDQRLSSEGPHVENEIAHAVAESLIGVEPVKGTGITAAPLGLAAALLQDPRGSMGVARPPNFAQLINQIFLMGVGPQGRNRTDKRNASELWYDAVTKIARRGDFLRRIDAALFEAVIKHNIAGDTFAHWPPPARAPASGSLPEEPPAWWTNSAFDLTQTPFGWFAEAWGKLCSDAWIEALPPRRWTDWASCLLRQALAFCFLWEAHFFRTLGRYLVMPAEESVSGIAARLQSPPMGLIPWVTSGSITSLDVKPSLRELIRAGHACRAAFWAWQEEGVPPPKEKSIKGMLTHVSSHASKGLRATIRGALDGSISAGGLNNLVETVEYSLLCRRDTGRSADFYGLTKTVSRRFTHVVPSPEWIVVISAMAAHGPREPCRLADVLESLQRLGLQPRIDTLVRELERAGLCASAPDGDEGILVSPAFGG